jgi:hypothetical protein
VPPVDSSARPDEFSSVCRWRRAAVVKMCMDDCRALGLGLGGGDASDEFVPR